MIRKTIIIQGYAQDLSEYNTDAGYTHYYKTYLTSNAGGAWEESEMLILVEPSLEQLQELIDSIQADYILVIFIGHGANQNDKQLFQINETTIIKAGQFILNTPKQLIILESCRTHTTDIYVVDLTDKPPQFKYGGYIRTPISREESKRLFWQQLNLCGEGIVICFACAENEEAFNYYFSLSLLGVSFKWHLSPDPHLQTLNILDLMDFVSEDVTSIALEKVQKKQTPIVIGDINFPFGVSKF